MHSIIQAASWVSVTSGRSSVWAALSDSERQRTAFALYAKAASELNRWNAEMASMALHNADAEGECSESVRGRISVEKPFRERVVETIGDMMASS